MKVYIGSDHGGFELKEHLKSFIEKLGFQVIDFGTYSQEAVDYPDIAFLVAEKVSQDKGSLGIMIDGAGMGSAICANKVPGVRAAACYDTYGANNSRQHNDVNLLTLGSMITGKGLAEQIVKTWLQTSFEGGRHCRRVEKIMAIEKRFLKETNL